MYKYIKVYVQFYLFFTHKIYDFKIGRNCLNNALMKPIIKRIT